MTNEIVEMFEKAINIDHLTNEEIKTLEEIFKDYK
jgi:hypothetical protein